MKGLALGEHSEDKTDKVVTKPKYDKNSVSTKVSENSFESFP